MRPKKKRLNVPTARVPKRTGGNRGRAHKSRARTGDRRPSALSTRVIRKQKKFRGTWISVEDWTYRRSDGLVLLHETLVDDDTAVVLPLDEKTGRVHLIREFRDPFGGFSWRLPWGYVEKNESPKTAARRELAEEAGLKSAVLTRLLVRRPEGKIFHQTHGFLATGLSPTRAMPEDAENIRVVRLPLSRAVRMALSGRINEPVISMLILRAAFLKKKIMVR